MRQPSRFSAAGFESMKLGAFLLFGRTKRPDLHRTARPRFSPLSAGSSVLDALWIVAIILEQLAYALIVPSRPIRFGLLILLPHVLPRFRAAHACRRVGEVGQPLAWGQPCRPFRTDG